MCLVKKPKVSSSSEQQKDPPIIRNPFLDGLLGNIAALRGGRNSLRIDLVNPIATGGGGGGATIGGGSGGSSSGGSSSGSSSSGGGSGSTSGSSRGGLISPSRV